MSDLEALIPQSIELVIDGEPLAIKPLNCLLYTSDAADEHRDV